MLAAIILSSVFIAMLAWVIAMLAWVIATEHADARQFKELDNHPGRAPFLRHVEAWQIIARGGELAKPTVDEMVTHYGCTPAEAQEYVDQWDERAEIEQHAERVQLADFASKVCTWIDPQ